MTVAALEQAELGQAAALLAQEGWTFTPKELARVLATGPGLSVAAREHGRLLGVVMVARHGDLAWVGNVVVAPERRGKGLGEELVKAALERIAAHGIATTKLCSVPLARTLYERLGFEAEGPVHTYAKVHERPTHRPVEAELLFPEDLGAMLALDHAFGADRRALLRQLLRDYPDTGVGLREGGELRGFAFLKVGEEGSELGPVVLADAGEAAAAQLLDAALGFRLQGPAAAVECSFAASHPFLGSLLAQRGFAFREPPKELMSRGPARAQDWVRCAALAGLEKG